jgi:hypothetical protein
LVFHVDYSICVYGKHCFVSPLFLPATYGENEGSTIYNTEST